MVDYVTGFGIVLVYCSREVDNPVYEGTRHIVFRTPPPVIPPSDPIIYERAGAHKSALPFRYKLKQHIFDEQKVQSSIILLANYQAGCNSKWGVILQESSPSTHSAIFDDPVYAGGTALSRQSTTTSKGFYFTARACISNFMYV